MFQSPVQNWWEGAATVSVHWLKCNAYAYVVCFLQYDSLLNQFWGEYTSHIKLVFVLWLTYVSAFFLPGHLPSRLFWRRWYILCLWPREVSLSGWLQLGWKWWVFFVLFEAMQAIYFVKLFSKIILPFGPTKCWIYQTWNYFCWVFCMFVTM